jgi:hypothetical protein
MGVEIRTIPPGRPPNRAHTSFFLGTSPVHLNIVRYDIHFWRDGFPTVSCSCWMHGEMSKHPLVQTALFRNTNCCRFERGPCLATIRPLSLLCHGDYVIFPCIGTIVRLFLYPYFVPFGALWGPRSYAADCVFLRCAPWSCMTAVIGPP